MMDVLVMDALMIGTLLAGFGLLRLFLGWCIDRSCFSCNAEQPEKRTSKRNGLIK